MQVDVQKHSCTLNHRKKMKAGHSRLVARKCTQNLVLLTERSQNALRRAGLNECEAQGKVVTARPPKRLAQLSSVSHALVSTLQKQQSKTSKQIRYGSLQFKRTLWLTMYGALHVVE